MVLAALLLATGSVPATDDDTITPPGPVRRTTLVVADLEPSLRFFRDLLGMRIVYDVTVDDPTQLALLGEGVGPGRAVALTGGESVQGSIGLFAPRAPTGTSEPESCPAPGAPGTASLLFLTAQITPLHNRLAAAGARIVSPPVTYRQQGRGFAAFSAYAPACVLVVFAEALD